MRKFKMIVAYDGTDYFGWQFQPNAVTVSSALQDIFEKTFGQKISITGASRTDSGVHALGQVATFRTDLNLEASKLMYALNYALPKSILIRSMEEVPASFHPCSNVLQKTYYYVLFLKQPLPMVSRFGWHYKCIGAVDWDKFNKALRLYIGEHDFSSFCKISKEDNDSPVRKIDEISLKKNDKMGAFMVSIKGKSFLRFQIRRMIGYALDVARRSDLSVDFIHDILENPNPAQTLLKADGSGLCLRKVIYNENFSIQRRIF